MEGSVEAQTIVSPTKEVNLEAAVVAEPVQHNGVEDVVSTNGASEVQHDETTEDESLAVKKRKSLDGEGDQEIECKRLKTTHPEGEEPAVAEETNTEQVEEKTEVEESKPEAEEKTEEETKKESDVEEPSKAEESKEEKETEPEAQA